MNPAPGSQMIWLQIVVGVLLVFCNGGILIYVLKSFKAQIDKKPDKALCDERHQREDERYRRTNADLDRGRDEFKELRDEIGNLSKNQGETNTLLTSIKDRIDDHLKKPGNDPGG